MGKKDKSTADLAQADALDRVIADHTRLKKVYKRPIGQNETRLLLCKLPWLLLLPLGMLWPRVCRGIPAFVERYYSAGVYPVIRDSLSALTSPLPISLAELILYALLIGAAAVLIGSLILWVKRRISGKRVLSAVLSLAILGGAIWNLFYVTWGFNYFRTPLAARMGLTVCARSSDELAALTGWLAAEAGTLRATLAEDENGAFTLNGELQQVLDALPYAYEMLGKLQPVYASRTTRAKRVLNSEGLSWAGIAGIYIGLTAEPNINAAQPDLLLPQAAAHEMAHQMGIASENEAEFSAHLACLASSDSRVRYSGTMQALISCINALYDADAVRGRALTAALDSAIKRDIRDYNAYWQRYDGPVEEAFDESNDRYLKHNNQTSGVKSYGEAVDLLLAYYDLTNNLEQ